MGQQEILPPTHRPDGRFAPGNNANPNGRGGGKSHTKAIKDMVKEALEMVGGANYLAWQAINNPNAFLALVGRTMPLKIASDEESPFTIQVIERRVLDPLKK